MKMEEEPKEKLIPLLNEKVTALMQQGQSIEKIIEQTVGELALVWIPESELSQLNEDVLTEKQDLFKEYGKLVGAYYQEKADAHGPVGDI